VSGFTSQITVKALDKATGVFSKIAGSIDRLQGKSKTFTKLEKSMHSLNKASNHLQKAFAGMSVTGIGAVAAFGATFLKTSLEFEKFGVILETTEGSSAKAKKAMDWVSTFARKTPYEVGEVTEAFVRLRAYGLDPTKGLMNSLGNASSAMGKDLMASIEMMADAVTGENERLKEFGIKAKKDKSSNTTSFSYTDKAGMQRSKTVSSDDRKAIQAAITGIFDIKYNGAMVKLSSSLGGIFSNLADTWSRFQLMVMNSKLFDTFKKDAQGLLTLFDQMASDGRLQTMADKFAKTVLDIYTKARQAIEQILPVVLTLVGIIDGFANAIGGYGNLLIVILSLSLLPTIISVVQAIALIMPVVIGIFGFLGQVWGVVQLIFMVVGLFMNPIGWIIAAVTALVGIGLLLYNNFKPFKDLWDGIVNSIKNAVGYLGKISGDAWNAVVSWATGGKKPATDGTVKVAGARALGGSVSASKPYLVGERGAELFVPGRSGTIVPNNALGGGSGKLEIVVSLQGGQPQIISTKQTGNLGINLSAGMGYLRT
jgi:Tape measure protein